MLFQCPHCSTKLEVPDDYVGRKGRCTKCRNPIVVPEPHIQAEASEEMVPLGVRTDGTFEYECIACGRPLDPPFGDQCPACKALLGGSAADSLAYADESTGLPPGVRYANSEQSEYECAYCGWPLSPSPFAPRCSQCNRLLSGEDDTSPTSVTQQPAAVDPAPIPRGRQGKTHSPGPKRRRLGWWVDMFGGIAEFTSEHALWGIMLLVLAVVIAWMKLSAYGDDPAALLANASTVKAIMTAAPIAVAVFIFLVGQVVAVRSQSGVLGMVAAALAASVAVASPAVGNRMLDRWAQEGADAAVRELEGRDWASNESRQTLPRGVANVLQDPSLVAVATKAVGDTNGPEGYAHAVAVLVAIGVSPASTFELCSVPAVQRTAAFTSLSRSAQERALSKLAGVLQTRPDRSSLIAAATNQLRAEAEAKAAAARRARYEDEARERAQDAEDEQVAALADRLNCGGMSVEQISGNWEAARKRREHLQREVDQAWSVAANAGNNPNYEHLFSGLAEAQEEEQFWAKYHDTAMRQRRR